MTDTDNDTLPTRPNSAPPVPTRIGQATAVEQTRAAAQVHAQVLVAKQSPRDLGDAIDELKLSCSTKAVAEKAFYRYRRGDGPVNGITISLAREMARCFRNIDYGLAELHRDDVEGMSEMMAFAWDLENNTRATSTFFVPHRRYIGGDPLSDLRDIYENNASAGGRRVREMIKAVLPPWFIEEAEAACHATLQKGDKPIEQRQADAVAVFDGLGVTEGMLVAKLGRPVDSWSPADLAQLSIIRRSLSRHETTVADEFPAALVTAEDLAAQSADAARAPDSPQDADAGPTAPDTPPEAPEAEGDPAPPADGAPGPPPVASMTVDELKKLIRKAGTSQAITIKTVAEMEHEARTLDEIVADPEALADVVDWLTAETARKARK